MSSVEVKEQVNRICRLARSFKEIKALCNTATIEAMEITNAIQSARFTGGDQESVVLLDFQEVDRLKKENEEMKMLLSDYHRGVELLMEAFRKRTLSETEEQNSVTPEECFDPQLLETIVKQSNRISEMHSLMKKTAAIDNNAENLITEHIAYLRKENAVLRELYEISTQFGSDANNWNMEDKICQTENENENENEENELSDSDSDSNSDDDDVITVISLKLDESDVDDDDDDDDEKREILKCPCPESVTSAGNNSAFNETEDT